MHRVIDSIGRLVYAYDTPPPGTNHAGSTIRGGCTQGRTPSYIILKQEIEGLEYSTTPIDITVLPTNVGENITVTEFNQE